MAKAVKRKKELTIEEKLAEALVPVEEQPYPINNNWKWLRLKALCNDIIVPQRDKPKSFGGNIPWCRIEDIEGKFLNGTLSGQYVTEETIKKMNLRVCPSGTVICSCSASLGRQAILTTACCTNQTFIGLVCHSLLYNEYLYYYLKSLEDYWHLIGTGTTIKYISRKKFELLPIPLPSLPEQQRIVDRIESLFAKLDEAKEKAQTVVDGFEDRKAAILHKAFTGELTEEWRKEKKLFPENYIQKAQTKREKIREEKKVKKLKYSFPDDIVLFDIPETWQYLQIGDIAWSIKDGPHYSPDYVEKGVPFITGGNVRPEGVDFTTAKRITKQLHVELSKRCHPEKGDMLYTKGGTTGIARVNTYDFEFSVWVHVAVIKYVDIVLPAYFQYVLNSPFCYEQSQKYTHGVGNQDLGLTRMINIVFPVCSIAEQTEICNILDDLIYKEQQAKEAAEQVISQIDTMKKSILARAFRGELGTNDPADESAVELLKRIL